MVLNGVGVLEFIHQYLRETALIVFAQGRVVAQQLEGAQQQFGEIHQPGTLAAGFVFTINLDPLAAVRVLTLAELRRTAAGIFVAIDKPLRLARRPVGLVEFHVFQHALHHAVLVFAVQNLEVLREPGLFPVAAQQSMRQSVKGTDPHTTDTETEHGLDAPAHFGGRLVGKGHGQNAVRRGA